MPTSPLAELALRVSSPVEPLDQLRRKHDVAFHAQITRVEGLVEAAQAAHGLEQRSKRELQRASRLGPAVGMLHDAAAVLEHQMPHDHAIGATELVRDV